MTLRRLFQEMGSGIWHYSPRYVCVCVWRGVYKFYIVGLGYREKYNTTDGFRPTFEVQRTKEICLVGLHRIGEQCVPHKSICITLCVHVCLFVCLCVYMCVCVYVLVCICVCLCLFLTHCYTKSKWGNLSKTGHVGHICGSLILMSLALSIYWTLCLHMECHGEKSVRNFNGQDIILLTNLSKFLTTIVTMQDQMKLRS